MPLCALLGVFAATVAQAQTIWEITPYRIAVFVALEQAPPLTPRLEQQVLRTLRQRSDRVIGAVWQLNAEPAPRKLRGPMVDDLAGISYGQLVEHWPEVDSVDKVVLLALATTLDGYRAAAREFDVRTRTWGAPIEYRFGQAPLAAGEAFRALLASFRPLAKIQSSKGNVATVQFRAGGLTPRDPNLRLVSLGDVLQPIIRRNDRQGNPLAKRGIEPIAWTYLTLAKFVGNANSSGNTNSSGNVAICKVHSGRRGVLSARHRGRTERLAIVVRPGNGATEVRLRARKSPATPLAGYDVHAAQPRSLVSLLRRHNMLSPEQIRELRQYAQQYPQRVIGDLAVAGKLITADQLTEATASFEEQEGAALADHLVQLEMVSEDDMQRFLRNLAQGPEEELLRLAIHRGWLKVEQFAKLRALQSATELLGRSDDDGNFRLLPREHPLQILYIKHGDALVAKLPIVPGLQAAVVAPIVNNDQWLAAEALVVSLREALEDKMAEQKIVEHRCRLKIEKKQFSQSRDDLARLGDLLREFSDLDDQVVAGRKQLTQQGQSVSQAKQRLDQNYEAMKQLLSKYQDEALIELDKLTRLQEAGEDGSGDTS